MSREDDDVSAKLFSVLVLLQRILTVKFAEKTKRPYCLLPRTLKAVNAN